jgi:sugar/nucleoside kinase (ribokinase family)
MGAVRFVAVGDVMIDVVAEGTGHDARIAVSAGGSAVNAAMWAHALGAESTVVGRIGDDPGGRLIRSELESRGIRAELSVDTEAPTGTFLLAESLVSADRGANATFSPDHLPRLDADAVLVSGYLPRPSVEAALAAAEARWVALDAAQLAELPAGGNVLIANEDILRRIGIGPEGSAEPPYEVVVETRGRRGAVAVVSGSITSAEPPKQVDGDRPGTGDAFAAAFLVSLARGDSVGTGMASACALAAEAADGTYPE